MHIDTEKTGKRIAVIGGGASGCMAAIAAASAGCRVFLFEKNEKLAKKIYATGNGRCNLTNLHQDPSCYHTGAAGRFSGVEAEDPSGRILDWIRQFSQNDLISFFQRAGVPVHDRDGWVYPRTDQAQTIVRALEKCIRAQGIEVFLNASVESVEDLRDPRCPDRNTLGGNARFQSRDSLEEDPRYPDRDRMGGDVRFQSRDSLEEDPRCPDRDRMGGDVRFRICYSLKEEAPAHSGKESEKAYRNRKGEKKEKTGKPGRKQTMRRAERLRQAALPVAGAAERPEDYEDYHDNDRKELVCDAVILCTGGLAGPSFGCSGDGYRLARRFSHHIRKPLPALTQIVCGSPYLKYAAGVRCQAKIALYAADSRGEGFCAAEESGELQVTDYGLSGIPVFQLSRTAAQLLDAGRTLYVRIDFLPWMTEEVFARETGHRLQTETKDQMLSDFFLGLVHKKVLDLVLASRGWQSEMKARRLTDAQLLEIMELLRCFALEATGVRSFENAQVTCGGIPLGEVNDHFGSVYRPGLYFAGEVLDVDGRCGGYNLQWAMTSGTLAGRAAAGCLSSALHHTETALQPPLL